jgi:hypothetical protein
MTRDPLTAELHQRLGYRRLSRGWAKAEILLGLLAAGTGLLLGQYAVAQPSPSWELAAAGLGLFVLGGYLALAGHRSHLYQSANERLALLVEEIRQLHSKGPSS